MFVFIFFTIFLCRETNEVSSDLNIIDEVLKPIRYCRGFKFFPLKLFLLIKKYSKMAEISELHKRKKPLVQFPIYKFTPRSMDIKFYDLGFIHYFDLHLLGKTHKMFYTVERDSERGTYSVHIKDTCMV